MFKGLNGSRFRYKDDSWEFKRLVRGVTRHREERLCFDCAARAQGRQKQSRDRGTVCSQWSCWRTGDERILVKEL
eukprot:5770220-Ditylum_brightwellii.AAC.1